MTPLRSFNINELTTVPQGARNYKAFLEGLKDAKREKDLAYLELTAGIVGTVSYLRYRNAKKAGR